MDIDKLLAASMLGDELRLSLVGNNIANISTPGYKRQSSLLPAFDVQFDASVSSSAQLQIKSFNLSKSYLDVNPGAMRGTNNKQDFYVEGNGFVEVSSPEGVSYIRQATLRVDAEGRLVNQNGLPVHTFSGEINLPSKPFSLNAEGDIVQDGEIVARLKIMEPDDIHSMVAVGGGLYRFSGEMHQVENGRLKIGFIEASNVEASREMTTLLETVRHFESLQKIAQTYSELHDKAVRYLGEF